MIAAFDGLRFKRRYNGSKASLFIMRTMWENNSKTSHFARKKVLDWNHASVASYIHFLLISDTNCFFTSFGWTDASLKSFFLVHFYDIKSGKRIFKNILIIPKKWKISWVERKKITNPRFARLFSFFHQNCLPSGVLCLMVHCLIVKGNREFSR